jgi:hypothetical protein
MFNVGNRRAHVAVLKGCWGWFLGAVGFEEIEVYES